MMKHLKNRREYMNLPSKGLIVKHEWLQKIFDTEHPKDWEIRGTNTKIRGRIALIESGTGTIVGECVITDSFRVSESRYLNNRDRHQIPWSYYKLPYRKPHAWVLSDVKKYDNPVPYKHKQGSVIWVNLEE